MKKYYFEKLDTSKIDELCKRSAINFDKVIPITKSILENVKINGDKALKEYGLKFDKVSLDNFLVSKNEIENACNNVPSETKNAFLIAKKNIEKFHKSQVKKEQIIETMSGVTCFRESRAIEKVGLYVPGGTAPLPSTVLMLGIPAKIAGCEEVIMCTPPNIDGKIPEIILFTAYLVGIKKIYKVGGAQAIAAMAYGTKTISKVYKIFGPGNQYVTCAKMLVSTDGIAIDMPAGPSEVLIIADKNANASFVAADLLSQAEHGVDSQAVLVCTDENKTDEVLKEIDVQIVKLPRYKIAKESIDKSFSVICKNLDEAISFSNSYAPEHLILNIKKSDKYLEKIKNAGSVFIGQYSCESAGDYASGTNHTLPTYGYAKAFSGVSTNSFIKQVTFQKLNADGVKNIGKTVMKMAEIEGLTAHKNAMEIRFNAIKN